MLNMVAILLPEVTYRHGLASDEVTMSGASQRLCMCASKVCAAFVGSVNPIIRGRTSACVLLRVVMVVAPISCSLLRGWQFGIPQNVLCGVL